MQNVHLFLPKSRRMILGIAAASLITLNVLTGSEEDSPAVVHAWENESTGKESSVEANSWNAMEEMEAPAMAAPILEETEQGKQIQLDEQMEAIAAESVAAMQNDLAAEAAREENKIQLSQTDEEVLLRIVEAEATGEDVTGKMLVANVVLNRVNDDEFPDTVEEVVFQRKGKKYQFSPIRDGRYYEVSISDTTKEAVERVLYGEDESQGALYFMSRWQADSQNVKWFDQSLTWLLEHGTHEFFK